MRSNIVDLLVLSGIVLAFRVGITSYSDTSQYYIIFDNNLATGQAPVSAVSGAVAATPVEQSAIEDQVLHTSLLFTCYIKLYHVV